jgi:hypothetical protein
MSDDIINDLNLDGEFDEMTLKKLLDITKKNDVLTKIKDDLKNFTSNLEKSEIIKNMGNVENVKKNN